MISPAEFSGTAASPKQFDGDVSVLLNGTAGLAHADIEGDLVITGAPGEEFTFEDITVGGDLIIELDEGEIFNFDGITVEGEIIFN